MDWHHFSVKNSHKEQCAFEQMSYLLFCSELGNNIGLFRYKNQTGIETEPLENDGKFYAFSAKFYEVNISERKDEIIEAITKAKNKNKDIDCIYFYVNKELSESSLAGKKQPNYLLNIEDACKKLGISLEWRVPSHFELQLALPRNKYIFDLFFNLNPTLDQLHDNVKQQNLKILNAIRTSISVGDKKIEIDRKEWVSKIIEKLGQYQNIIISGEGGSGKTAIIKRFYDEYSNIVPICIFKASELNIHHLSDLFKFDHNFSLANFFDTYAAEPIKIFVIDSAEKLPEINNQTVLNDLITKLSTYGWKIIFTTRSSYLDDLQFHLNESYNLNCKTLKLSQISNQELNEISDKFDIELPKNENFKDRIRNLFYLNAYVKYQSDETVENFADFIDLLWKKKIQNNEFIGDDIHIERGRCLQEIAKKRAQTSRFYNDGDGLSQKALAGLKQDEILGYDDKHDSYFITHDIYEEWALNRIINQAYLNDCTPNIFFETIENNLPIRRAFRNWLSQQLLENNNTKLKKFVKDVFRQPSIEQFWKDELLISVLLSDYSDEFFQIFEENLLADDFYIIKRVIFLLRLACNEVGDLLCGSKPKGKGWNATIKFIYKHKDSFFNRYYDLVLPLLLDWCLVNHQGATTQMAGLLALKLLDKVAKEKLYLKGKTEELVHNIIFVACNEIEDELTKIINFVVEHKLVEYNQPYNKLCSIIVKKSYQAPRLIQLLPKQVIKLCELFWFNKNYKKSPYGSYDHGVDVYYGIYRSNSDYFPVGAY